jgi:hypothetical protein
VGPRRILTQLKTEGILASPRSPERFVHGQFEGAGSTGQRKKFGKFLQWLHES